MVLVPGEKAVLKQILDLFLEASLPTYRVIQLTSRWPVTHYDAYRLGYDGLVRKGLITASADQQSFSITNAGLGALRKV